MSIELVFGRVAYAIYHFHFLTRKSFALARISFYVGLQSWLMPYHSCYFVRLKFVLSSSEIRKEPFR